MHILVVATPPSIYVLQHTISMVSFSPEANCEKLVNYSGHATVKDGNKINPVAVAVIRWGGLPGIFYIFHSLNVNILTRKQHPT